MKSVRLARSIGHPPHALRQWATIRAGQAAHFSSGRIVHAITQFKMPAMSPTMTEGTITQWRVKEGEKFYSGDVLLEIETDKAHMDVEAQDDGVLAKIVVPDGSQHVNVGKIIAVVAEEGDDISNVEVPTDDGQSAQTSTEAAKEEHQPEQPQEVAATTTESKPKHDYDAHYTPAVLSLLQQYGVENPKKIPHAGPKGRLLKGDVLAFVGAIQKDIPKTLSDIIVKKTKLDLSNVVKQAPPPKDAKPALPSKSAVKPLPSIETVVRLSAASLLKLPVDGVINTATSRALADVPAFGLRKVPESDIIFAELVGEKPNKISYNFPPAPPAPLITSAPTTVSITYGSKTVENVRGKATLHFEPVTVKSSPSQKPDLYDEILGISTPVSSTSSTTSSPEVRVRLEYDDKIIDSTAAAAYLARFQHHVEYPVAPIS